MGIALLRMGILTWIAVAHGQQTLINLPSPDVTPRKKLFLLHETQARPWSPEPYWATSNFIVYGLSSNVELGITLYELGVPKQEFSAVAMGYKWSQPLFRGPLSRWNLRTVLGQMLTFSLHGHGKGLWTYLMGSLQVPMTKTRLSAGVTFGPRALFGGDNPSGPLGVNTIAFIGSAEQPVTEWLDVVVEWFSGEGHEFAYATPGLVIHVGNWTFVVGYKFANSEEEEHTESLIVEVGTLL
ncbi:MAG: hypothetical protein N3E49_06925 [Bacteroidia bacterium]|nr:hypothetical protein [Bacteroidia bacterium]